MTVPVNGHACRNSASLSCANGWPSSVNTFISCRLSAAAVEQKTSSGMNQMKEQIIPSSPWMTCSSDPESVFASLASLKALLPKCGVGKSGYIYVSVCVCVSKCACLLVFRLSFTYITLFQSLLASNECQYRSNNVLKLNLMEWWMSALNVQYISTELKSRDTSCSLCSSSLLPSLKAVVFYLFEFPHVSQSEASGRLGTYLT